MLRAPGRTAPEPCRPAAVVLDFDGTLTDADAHAPAFREASERELARRLGWDGATLRREWPRALAIVTGAPAEAAWEVDGHGVCPANADPYLTANSVTRLLLTEHRPDLGAAEVTARVLEVHRAAYDRVPPPFRPDARALLEELCGRGLRVRVVTNSQARGVERRLDALGSRGREQVAVSGDAGKFLVCAPRTPDARFATLAPSATLPGFARPILLHRGRYFDLLRAVWDETRTEPAATLVAGDVFELDLAMPAALGAHVHLVTRPSTMPHEVRLARSLARGDADPRLAALIERIDGRLEAPRGRC